MVDGMLSMVGSRELVRCMVDGTMDLVTFNVKLASYSTFSITIKARRIRLESLKEAASIKVASRLSWEGANLVTSGITLEETLTTLQDWEMVTWKPTLLNLTFNDLFLHLGLPTTLQSDLQRFL